jgi:phosphatidylglycerophosphate synthase
MKPFVHYIPNFLSFFRLGLAFFFPFSPEKLWVVLVAAGGLSDFLDGWFARRWGVTSWQGGLLDAVADKVFVLSALSTYVLAGKLDGWWVPAIISRDIMVASIATYAASRGAWKSFRKMDAGWPGKMATAGQFLLLVTASLASGSLFLFLCISTLLSAVAAADYAMRFRREFLLQAGRKSG